MLIEFITTETGRAGLKIKTETLNKTLLRRKVILSERKAFLESITALEKKAAEATEKGDDDAALEHSIEMVLLMLEGIAREDFDSMDIYDIRELSEAMAELMQNGGKAGKKKE